MAAGGCSDGKEGRGMKAHLGIARICVKDIREEFTGAGHARHDQAVDVVTVDDKVVCNVHCIPL